MYHPTLVWKSTAALFTLSMASAFGQSPLSSIRELAPRLANKPLYAVCSLSPSHAVAVGSHGQTAVTTDSGKTWIRRYSATHEHLRGIASGRRFMVAVGDAGVILRSSDAGELWERVPSGVASRLNSVCILSDAIAIASGDSGTIVRSDDSGRTWSRVAQASSIPLTASARRSETDVLIAGESGALVRSTDAGASWTSATISSSVDAFYVHWADETIVVVGRSGNTARSTDDGNTWSTQSLPGVNGAVTSAAFLDDTTGLLTWADPRGEPTDAGVLATRDAGRTWTVVSIGDANQTNLRASSVRAVTRSSDSAAIGVGSNFTFRISDRGSTWSDDVAYRRLSYVDVDFISDSRGTLLATDHYVDGSPSSRVPTAIVTVDGGLTWNATEIYRTNSDSELLHCLEMIDDTTMLGIPSEVGHRFRGKPATNSERSRPLIPGQVGHRFRAKPATL